MTDENSRPEPEAPVGEGMSPPPEPVHPPDDIVERTLEKAAEKVASVTVPSGPPIMNRTEMLVAVAVLLIINVSNLIVAVQAKNEAEGNDQDHKIICEVVEAASPNAIDPPILARCLK